MAEDKYPLPAFYFNVKIAGLYDSVSGFQEVTGLEVRIETEEIKQGGDNTFALHLPIGQPKYANLVLKRGLFVSSSLINWCKETFEEFKFSPKDIDIELLGMNGNGSQKEIKAAWNLYRAYPVKWDISAFKSQDNALAIESIEFIHGRLVRTV